MKDLEYECLKLGIPVKTRHNEVAPNQFELAPVYEEANLANDHNHAADDRDGQDRPPSPVPRPAARKTLQGHQRFGQAQQLESLGTDTGVNLLRTGQDTLRRTSSFIAFLVETPSSAVYKHNGLLKASIMSATNAHRLGANEAPPAIISTFLGNAGHRPCSTKLRPPDKERRRHPFRLPRTAS